MVEKRQYGEMLHETCDGTYLVRFSTRKFGDLVISRWNGEAINSYVVKWDPMGFFIHDIVCGDQRHSSVSKLIDACSDLFVHPLQKSSYVAVLDEEDYK